MSPKSKHIHDASGARSDRLVRLNSELPQNKDLGGAAHTLTKPGYSLKGWVLNRKLVFDNAGISPALRYFDQLPASASVRQPIVEALLGYSGSTVRRRVQDGTLPPPKRLSARVSAWNVGELREAMATLQGVKNV